MLRTGLIVILLSLLAGCVQTGDVPPTRTEEGRQKARQAYLDLAVGYLLEGMTGQAKVPLHNILKTNPNDAEALEALALVFQYEMELELAEEHFKRALAAKRSTRILNNYGSFLYEQGDYENAYKMFVEASKDTMYPNRAKVFESLGLAAQKLDRQDDALRYFQRAIRMNPQQPKTLLELGILYYEQKDFVTARRYYESFLTMSEHNAKSLLLGTRIASIFQDRNQAASLAMQLKQLYPASAEYRTYLSEQ